VFVFTCLVTFIAIRSELSIFKMVEGAYKITLVAAFVPLAFGLYWKRATPLGGFLSVVMGAGVWLICEWVAPDALIPPQLAGLMASLTGMIGGSLVASRKELRAA